MFLNVYQGAVYTPYKPFGGASGREFTALRLPFREKMLHG